MERLIARRLFPLALEISQFLKLARLRVEAERWYTGPSLKWRQVPVSEENARQASSELGLTSGYFLQ